MEMTELKFDVDPATVCRICLQDGEGEMTSIFERDSADEPQCLYEKIENCGGIKIVNDPEMPTRICRKCYACLKIAHKFRVICRNSDNYLREFVCKAVTNSADEDEEEEEEEYGQPEYLVEYNPETMSISAAQPLGTVEEEILADYDYIPDFPSEAVWAHENENGADNNDNMDLIEEDDEHDDDADEDGQQSFVQSRTSSNPSTQNSPTPTKTLGISSDGAAFICIKPEKQTSAQAQKKHVCDICGNCYPRKYSLESHMRRHRNERPYECEICHQSFHLNFQLTRHIRKHTGSRPYICQYCQRTFADRSTMVKHERIHRNERPYACDECGKNFTYSSVLKVHKMTHTGEKPFNCGICLKRFSRAHHLRAHLETQQHAKDPRSKVLITQIKRHEVYQMEEYVEEDQLEETEVFPKMEEFLDQA